MQQQQTSALQAASSPTEFFLPQTSRQDIRTALVRSRHTGSFIRITPARPLPGGRDRRVRAIRRAGEPWPRLAAPMPMEASPFLQDLIMEIPWAIAFSTVRERYADRLGRHLDRRQRDPATTHDRQARRHAPRRRHARPASGSRLSGGRRLLHRTPVPCPDRRRYRLRHVAMEHRHRRPQGRDGQAGKAARRYRRTAG